MRRFERRGGLRIRITPGRLVAAMTEQDRVQDHSVIQL